MKQTMLIIYVYWPPVGHAVEALRYSLGYHTANPDVEISILLEKNTPFYLADLCPWIKKTYTVDILDTINSTIPPDILHDIPREWDYVVYDERQCGRKDTFTPFYDICDQKISARVSKGFCGLACGESKIPYIPHQKLELNLPETNQQFARTKLLETKNKIAILTSGHGQGNPAMNPSLKSWKMIIRSLFDAFPDLSIYLIGKLKRDNKGTMTTGVSESGIAALQENNPKIINCFDLGLLNQLAIIHECDLFISPHTGFGFSVVAVGTPWMTISGTEWAEYFFNGTPFYSVLPTCPKYPCHGRMLEECKEKLKNQEKVACMSNTRIRNSMEELVKAAQHLVNDKPTYEECLEDHFKRRITSLGDKADKELYSFDLIHKEFLKERHH